MNGLSTFAPHARKMTVDDDDGKTQDLSHKGHGIIPLIVTGDSTRTGFSISP
jgi:hypothetical protein